MSRFSPAPEVPMSRLQKEPLRSLRPEERSQLERVSRALGLPAALVARAKVLLAVAHGHTYIEAAHLARPRTGDAGAALVSLFNRHGGRRSSRATLADRPCCTTRRPSSASCASSTES